MKTLASAQDLELNNNSNPKKVAISKLFKWNVERVEELRRQIIEMEKQKKKSMKVPREELQSISDIGQINSNDISLQSLISIR